MPSYLQPQHSANISLNGKVEYPVRESHSISHIAPAIELERTIGFSSIPNSIHYHPTLSDYVYSAGASIIISSINEVQNQYFLRGHDSLISCIALSPSGNLIASGEVGRKADILVWDYATKALKFRLSEHDVGIAALTFSHDERLLCSVGFLEDSKLYVWDAHTGNICATNQKLSERITAVAFGGMFRDVKRRDTKNYQFVTAGTKHLSLWVLNPFCGELTATKIEQSVIRNYTCVAFSPDREIIVAGSTSGDISVVHVKTCRVVQFVSACSCGVNTIAYTKDGVLVGGGDGSLIHFDQMNSYVDTCSTILDAPISGISVNTDETSLIAGTHAGSIFSVKLHLRITPQNTRRSFHAILLYENHSNTVVVVAFAPNVSDQFATISKDLSIRIWDASDYSVKLKCHILNAGIPTSLQYSLDILLSGWTDGSIRCNSSDTGELVWTIDNAHTGGVTALRFSNNQRFIVTGGVGGELRVWDIRKREMISHLKEHSMSVTQLVLYHNDCQVISCSRDRSILCWDLPNERRISSHIQRMGGINTVALSADQRVVLSVGQEKRITYWDLSLDDPINVILTAHGDEATCIAVANSLDLFATGGNDRLVKLWEYSSGKLLMDGIGHSGNVRSLQFSPDDRQLVSVGEDGCVFVWNVYIGTGEDLK